MIISKKSVTLVLCYFAMVVAAESGGFKVSRMLKKKKFRTTKTPEKMKKMKKGKVLKGKRTNRPTEPPTPDPDGKRTNRPTEPSTPDPDAKVWPPIFTQLAAPGDPLIVQPTTTAEATAMGWSKVNQPCDPILGEAWMFGGQRNIDSPMTIFFTPEVAGAAGVTSGLELDYYEYIEENFVGSYFSDERTAKDGTYHSLAVALRKDNVCDTLAPKAPANEPYVAVAPYMANFTIPTTESAPELSTNFLEGSCVVATGFHWAHDVVGGANLTYEAKNLMPIIPFYSSIDGTINGIMFFATEEKQVQGSNGDWKTNFWDKSPGIPEDYSSAFFCNNNCGTCQLSGSFAGYYTIMHWYFKDTQTFTSKDFELCGKDDFSPGDSVLECRSGFYPNNPLQ